ncbi:ABC transporter permease [Clostridium sp. C2-6-12]|uniref:ABC transporter permease n=1 Tax=Clostridium sp. C2-6-12 TaxID=2698832 RepID=UPI0013707BDB|nr:ABC transporter permease [Clostridium sp. C2-6-12]
MINLIRGEFYKLIKSKYLNGMIFLGICAGFLLIVEFEHEGKRMFGDINTVNIITFVMNVIIFSSFIFAVLSVAFIVDDFNNGGINRSFSYGFRRSKVILSKLIVFMILSLGMILLYTTILIIYVSYFYGLSGNLDSNTILYLVRTISIGLIYNLATISIIFMIATITRSNFCTLISSMIIFITFIIGMNPYTYPFISELAFFLPYCIGHSAIFMFARKIEIILCIVSSVITFIITIGGSLLYIKYKDIK